MNFSDVYCGVFAALGLCMLFGRVNVGIGSVFLAAATSAAIAAPLTGQAGRVAAAATTVRQCGSDFSLTDPWSYLKATANCAFAEG